MEKTISNPVITCCNAREVETAKRILSSHGFEFNQFEDSFEIYYSFTLKRLKELMDLIEAESGYSKSRIQEKILGLTPLQLQNVILTIHAWSFEFNDEKAARVETAKDVIDLLSQPEYMQEIQECESQTGEDYFTIVFGI